MDAQGRILPCRTDLIFLYRIRMEFSTQIMATPVSANTAIHMLACPARPRIITAILITRAKNYVLPCNTVCASCNGDELRDRIYIEFINTASAASMAKHLHRFPMAKHLTSAPARTGASLIPSPTNITVPCVWRTFFRALSLSSGRSFLHRSHQSRHLFLQPALSSSLQ